MPQMKSVWLLFGLAIASVPSLGTDTFGQGAVAFTPTVGIAPSGQTMTVTPVVSADRRYVRLSVNAFFNDVNGFSSFTTPLGAVSGAGGGGLGGGGLGGAGGGLRGVGLGEGGGNFNAGMNGVIGPAGLNESVGFAHVGLRGPVGEMRAGALPYDSGFGGVTNAGAAPVWNDWNDRDYFWAEARPLALTSPSETNRGSGNIATSKSKAVASPRRAARQSASHRQKARSTRAEKVKQPSDEEPIVKPKKAS